MKNITKLYKKMELYNIKFIKNMISKVKLDEMRKIIKKMIHQLMNIKYKI